MGEILSIGCCFWDDPKDRCHHVYRYSVDDVRLLYNGVKRHLKIPHDFFVMTDIKADFGDGIKVIPLDRSGFPPGSRYPKLTIFRRDAGHLIGQRIALLDLDAAIVGKLDPLFDRPEDLVLWRNPNFGISKRAAYNTSIILLRAGARPEFWDTFDARTSPGIANRRWGGTDQAWVSTVARCPAKDDPALWDDDAHEAYWDARHGVYGAGRLGDYHPELAHTVLPDNARIVFFPGRRHPAMAEVHKRHPWLKDHRY